TIAVFSVAWRDRVRFVVAADRQGPQVVTCFRAGHAEEDEATVSRPVSGTFEAGSGQKQLFAILSVGRLTVEIEGALPVRGEHDLMAVRGPKWKVVNGCVERQGIQEATICFEQPDIHVPVDVS